MGIQAKLPGTQRARVGIPYLPGLDEDMQSLRSFFNLLVTIKTVDLKAGRSTRESHFQDTKGEAVQINI